MTMATEVLNRTQRDAILAGLILLSKRLIGPTAPEITDEEVQAMATNEGDHELITPEEIADLMGTIDECDEINVKFEG